MFHQSKRVDNLVHLSSLYGLVLLSFEYRTEAETEQMFLNLFPTNPKASRSLVSNDLLNSLSQLVGYAIEVPFLSCRKAIVQGLDSYLLLAGRNEEHKWSF